MGCVLMDNQDPCTMIVVIACGVILGVCVLALCG